MLRLWRWLVMQANTIIAVIPILAIAEALRMLHERTFWAGIWVGIAFMVWSRFVSKERQRYCKEAA